MQSSTIINENYSVFVCICVCMCVCNGNMSEINSLKAEDKLETTC